MSLQVWLPLNGNLDNQGLADVSVINNGATVDTGGKIGSCYNFNGSGYVQGTTDFSNFPDMVSLAMWVNLKASASYQELLTIGVNAAWVGIRCSLIINSASLLRFSISDGVTSSQNTYYVGNIGTNTWVHVVGVYNQGEVTTYLNGIKTNTYTATITPKFSDITKFGIGANPSGAEKATCLINDVRIYDHALSPLEVKHLAQGLVLHYPLNRGGLGQDNLVNGLYAGGRTMVNNGIVTALLSQNSDCYFHFTCSEDLLAENDYTISMDVSGFSGSDKYLVCGIISQNSGKDITMRNGKCFAIFSPSSNITAGTKIIIDDRSRASSGLTDLTIRNIKVEHGSTPTPWTPAPSDDLYSQMGLDNNIEYDVSGFGNNGTRVGTFSWSGDTPRYNTSTYVKSSSSINHPRCLSNDDQEWTCCAWVKLDSSTSYQQLNNFNRGNIVVYGTTPILYLNGGSDDYYMYGSQVIPVDDWTHIAFVFKNSTGLRNIYINGILKNNYGPNETSTPSGIPDSVTLFGQNFAGYVSDYREYATALSADDVMALYKNAGYVDSDGNVYAYEITE